MRNVQTPMSPRWRPNARREPARISSLGFHPARPSPSPVRLARRRRLVTWAKWLLPMMGLALLASITLWPDFDGSVAGQRVSFRLDAGMPSGGGKLVDARYSSVDQRGEPYTVTAAKAVQAGPDRVNLVRPKGDITLQARSWLMLGAERGVYWRNGRQLDLSGKVTLYRDDGTTLRSSSATINLARDAAAGGAPVSAEGPFGTLDATGFSLFDGGAVIQFSGPARLVLNGRNP